MTIVFIILTLWLVAWNVKLERRIDQLESYTTVTIHHENKAKS